MMAKNSMNWYWRCRMKKKKLFKKLLIIFVVGVAIASIIYAFLAANTVKATKTNKGVTTTVKVTKIFNSLYVKAKVKNESGKSLYYDYDYDWTNGILLMGNKAMMKNYILANDPYQTKIRTAEVTVMDLYGIDSPYSKN